MITTSLNAVGRVIVSDDSITDDTPQNFTVCVKDESDWTEIHNYIIDENNIDNIPNRKIDCTSEKDDIYFNLSLIPWYYSSTETSPNIESKQIHDDLIQYSDAIYYKNGIYDKLYYDSSLVNAPIHFPYVVHKNANFYYRGMIFEKPDHVFFFEKPIFFVGGMGENVFTLEEPSENNN